MKKTTTVFLGMVVLAAGIIMLGNNFFSWDLDIFFDGWWTLFIIIPCLFGLLKKEFVSSTFGLTMGILMLLASRDVIKWSMVGDALLPLILILIGITIIFRPGVRVKADKKGFKEYVGIFAGNEQKITGEFNGAKIVSVFGDVSLDLREAKIKKDIVIDCVAIFGGVELLLPEGLETKASGIPIFGGVENKYSSDEGKLVDIEYVTIFASVDVK